MYFNVTIRIHKHMPMLAIVTFNKSVYNPVKFKNKPAQIKTLQNSYSLLIALNG